MKGFFASTQVEKQAPGGLIPKCGACGLFKGCTTPKMDVFGEGARKIMIIGERPSETDDEDGEPFSDENGSLLRNVLEDLNVDLEDDCWATNAIICAANAKQTPDTTQVTHCHPNLLAALREHRPRIVITLGHSALKSVLTEHWGSVYEMERWAGWRIPMKDFWLCPTYTPAWVKKQKGPIAEDLFREHIEAALEIKAPPAPPRDWEADVEIIYDDEEAYEAIKEIHEESELVAVDYETNCLKPEYPNAKIYSCSLSNGERTISYLWKGAAIEATGRLLKSKHHGKIASNLKMEEKWTRKAFGHGVRNWQWDTMLAAHCIDNRPGICGLKFQAFINLGVGPYNERVEPFLKSSGWYNRIEQVDQRELLVYGGMDALLEYELALIQMKELGYE